MKYLALVVAATGIVLTAAMIVPLAPSVDPDVRLPLPAGRPLDADEEKRLQEGRRAWIEEIHRAAPGTDWRALERANGLARMDARNSSARSPESSPWIEIGSRNLAGRMHAAVLSVNGDSLYAGSSRGGVWKADLSGNGWRPLSDNLWGGAHGLAVAGPPESVTRITDDGLVHVTEDGGLTWTVPAGALANIVEGKRVLSDPANPDRVYLLVRKVLGANVGKLYRSDDRGLSYTLIRTLVPDRGDMWIDRVSGGRLWLLEDDALLYTDDGGAGWTTAGTLPVSGMGDVVLAGSEAGAPTFYAATKNGSAWNLYRSTDAGGTWDWRHSIDDFWETLASSIGNANLVMFGGVELWRSIDGGASFTKVNGWGEYYGDPVHRLHADLPGLNVLRTPDGSEIHCIATDGGLYRSDDGVATVTNISLERLGVSQYYSTHTSVNDPDRILAGSQDQGYQRANGSAVGTLHDFDQLISGDYGHLTSSDGSHDWVFSTYPGFVLAQEGEVAPDLHTIDFPSGQSHSWMPYVLADPGDQDAFYFCGHQIVRYRHIFNTWILEYGAQDFTVSGGNYTTALVISAVDANDRITVTDTGRLWWSTDAGASWTLSADTGPSAHYFYGTALEFSPTVAGEAYVAGSGYSGPAAYRTTDGGATWSAVGGGLPPTLVYDIAYEPGGTGAIHAATDAGGYRLDPATSTWVSLDDAVAPLTTYWCVEAVPAAGVMRYGTYGRGIWDWQIQSVVVAAELPSAGVGNALRMVNAPNPFRDGTSIRFSAPRGASTSLRIHDATGRLVRDLPVRAGNGSEHVVHWDGRDGSGRAVASGVYFARLRTSDGIAVRRVTRLP